MIGWPLRKFSDGYEKASEIRGILKNHFFQNNFYIPRSTKIFWFRYLCKLSKFELIYVVSFVTKMILWNFRERIDEFQIIIFSGALCGDIYCCILNWTFCCHPQLKNENSWMSVSAFLKVYVHNLSMKLAFNVTLKLIKKSYEINWPMKLLGWFWLTFWKSGWTFNLTKGLVFNKYCILLWILMKLMKLNTLSFFSLNFWITLNWLHIFWIEIKFDSSNWKSLAIINQQQLVLFRSKKIQRCNK